MIETSDDGGQKNYRDITEIDERLEDCKGIHFALIDIRVEVRDRVLAKVE
jgi:hypothetical protein